MGATLVEIDASLPKVEMPAKPKPEEELKSLIKETLAEYMEEQNHRATLASKANDQSRSKMIRMITSSISVSRFTADPLGKLSEEARLMMEASKALFEMVDETYELLDMAAEELGLTKVK